MMTVRSLPALLVVLILAMPSLQAQDSIISFAKLGFTLVPPEAPQPGAGTVVLAFLPQHHGFSANVNVLVQPFQSTLKDYDQLTQTQFTQEHMTVITQEVKPDGLAYEYQGKLGERNLHFFTRALKRNDAVYLITATDLEEDWAADKLILIHSVASFAFTQQHP